MIGPTKPHETRPGLPDPLNATLLTARAEKAESERDRLVNLAAEVVTDEQIDAALSASWKAAGFDGINPQFWNGVDRKRMRAALLAAFPTQPTKPNNSVETK